MMSKKSLIYRFLCTWWVLITMAPRISININKRYKLCDHKTTTYNSSTVVRKKCKESSSIY